jgi:nicotinamide-nucleotide amidase
VKYSESYIITLSEELGRLLLGEKLFIATAESCTGGGLSYALTAVPGSSQWFERGYITYSNASKQNLLNIPETLISTYGAVSQETVTAMAEGALKNSEADISIAITGIAGPEGGSTEKPVGTVWLGLAGKKFSTKTLCQHFTGNREEIRLKAIQEALFLLHTTFLAQYY